MTLIGKKGPTMEHRTPLSPGWVDARDDLSARRAARASREIRKRELASFTTATDQHELYLDPILDRADPQAPDNIRSLIHRRSAARPNRSIITLLRPIVLKP